MGDTVIIIAYALMTPEEAAGFEPKVVMVDENNRPVNVRGTEKRTRNRLIKNLRKHLPAEVFVMLDVKNSSTATLAGDYFQSG